MQKKIAIVIAASLLIAGVLGFVPGLNSKDASGMELLFGLFMTGAFHNIFHIVSGAAGLWSVRKPKVMRRYLVIMGLTYAVLAVLGFAIGITRVNMADNFLHVGIAIVLLASYVLFKTPQENL